MDGFVFYLGTHRPGWLAQLDVPLFVSYRTLRERRTMPQAVAPWALDSGAFTELALHGRWTVEPEEYADAVRRIAEAGRLVWACPQDWVCAPPAVASTGLSVAEHVERSVASFLELRALAPEVAWAPVLQGWAAEDYHRCADLMEEAGVNLAAADVVTVGSIAARSGAEGGRIVRELAERGYRLHGLGVKATGLAMYGECLASADSTAWSMDARFGEPLPGCTHASCKNCPRYALAWRDRVLAAHAGRLAHLDRCPALF